MYGSALKFTRTAFSPLDWIRLRLTPELRSLGANPSQTPYSPEQ